MAKKKTKQPEVMSNGLGEAIFGPGYGPGFSAQLSQVATLFKNERWYLISNMRQILSEMYCEHGLVQTVVDVPVDDGLRGGIEIVTKQLNEEEIDDLMVDMDRKKELQTVAQALKWNRLFGGAGILIMTDQDPMQPLNVDLINENSPLEFRACDLWELFWASQNAVTYTAAEQDYVYEYYDYYGVRVHASRVMKMQGIQAPSFVRPRLRGWGLSIIEALVRSINQYLKANNLTFEVLDEFKLDIYKIKNLTSSLLSDDGMQRVRKRVELANLQKNYQNAITMDAEDDYTQKELSFAGIAEAMAGIRMQVASDLRMPLTKVFGISAAGFSSGEDDIENYNAMVESQVRQKSKFDILRMIELKCKQKFGFIPDDLKINFKPLRMLSAEQEENVKTQQFNRLMQAKQAGELDGKQFKEACNKNNLLPIQLDPTVDTLPGFDQAGDEGESAGKVKAEVKGEKSKLTAKEPKEVKNEADQQGAAPQIVTVGLLSQKGQLLTGKRRDNGLWTNPGGHMDAGETPSQAAVREVFEESGFFINESDLRHISSEVIKSHRTGKDFVLHCYTANVGEQQATSKNDPDNEIVEWKWVDVHPSTPELLGSARHAAKDQVVDYVLKQRRI